MFTIQSETGQVLTANGTLRLAAVTPPPPYPVPPTVTRPSWAAGTALREKRLIPNSTAITPGNLFLVNDARRAAGMPLMQWGQPYSPLPNKYGHMPDNNAGATRNWPNGYQMNLYGSATDPRNGRVFMPLGDTVNFQHTGWCAFEMMHDMPVWISEVIETGDHREVKVDMTNPMLGPNDDPRVERNFDGSCRAQHGYSQRAYMPTRNWLGMIGHQQFGPGDFGGSPTPVMADLATRLWIKESVIPDRPRWANDTQQFVRVDHHSGNVFSMGGNVLSMLDASTLQWRDLHQVPASNVSLSIDHERGEVLAIATPAVAGICSLVAPVSGYVQLTGSRAAQLQVYNKGGLTYCPHRHAHLWFDLDTYDILELKRVDANTMQVELFTNVGPVPPVRNRYGGMLNDFFSVPALGGVVARIDDFSPMMFIGTV